VQDLGWNHVPQSLLPPPYMYEMAYRRQSKGTGVFIPRASAPTRKNRSGRSNSINNGSQRQRDKSGVAVSPSANNDRLQSYYYKNSGSLKNRTWLRFTTCSLVLGLAWRQTTSITMYMGNNTLCSAWLILAKQNKLSNVQFCNWGREVEFIVNAFDYLLLSYKAMINGDQVTDWLG